MKAAVKGASIVVYFGHGNGWPSPYTYDPKYTTKDGFGLNATAGHGDSNNKYYGEPYVATLDLAPNAVVILSNLCYASGNSEPGDAAPSQTTARKRVDNYGAGFLKAARGGHRRRARRARSRTSGRCSRPTPRSRRSGGAPRTSTTTSQSFASSRTPGAVAFTDTDTADERLLPVARLATGPDDRPGDRRGLRRHRRRPVVARRPRERRGRRPPAPRCTARTGPSRHASPPAARLRVVEDGNTIGRDRDRPGSGWRASTTRRSRAGSRPTDLLPKDSKAPAVWGLDTAGGVVLPQWRRAVRLGLDQRPLLRDGRLARPDPRRRYGPARGDRHRQDLRA